MIIMDRSGTKTPEELIDKALVTGEQIISTTCECCGKIFYILKSDLYAENDYRLGDGDFKIDNFHKIDYPKCPYCGYAGRLELNICNKKD